MSSIVAHFVAGYPSPEASLAVARGLIRGGALALEMQIPFSDPCADGPVIETACTHVLKTGFRVDDALGLLKTIRSETDIPLFVMSYASLVVAPGVTEFVRRVKEAGASGLIVPDLPPGADEGLFSIAAKASCPAVPVIVPSISEERMNAILAEPAEWIYVALRSGITGTRTELGKDQQDFLNLLKQRGASMVKEGKRTAPLRVMAGFGIQNAEQVKTVTAMAEAAVVGSLLVKAVGEAAEGDAGKTAQRWMERLISH